MKILMLIDSFTVGGAQRQFTTIAKELHKSEEVTVVVYYPITSHFEDELNSDGVKIIKILKQSRIDLIFVIKLLRFMFEEKFDVSISFLDTPNFYNVLARILRCVPKIIVSQRSAYFKESISIKKRIQESLMYFADYITTNSITQKQRMEEMFPFLKEKIFFLPNAYKSSEISNFCITNNNFIVLSNLNEYKNPLKLVEAVKILVKEFHAIKFKINWYGRFPITEKAKLDFEKAKSIINTNKLNDYIEFNGIISNVNKVIADSAALIHISDFEGCPNGVCEAMALGKPVILSNVCDHPFLVSYNNGILVDQNNPKDIASGIFDFINKPNCERVIMGHKSKRYINENFNLTNSIKTLKKIL
jgi:glycosyltransferase involved in cell wall biosynthesis